MDILILQELECMNGGKEQFGNAMINYTGGKITIQSCELTNINYNHDPISVPEPVNPSDPPEPPLNNLPAPGVILYVTSSTDVNVINTVIGRVVTNKALFCIKANNIGFIFLFFYLFVYLRL
jgi:hypothetical protein